MEKKVNQTDITLVQGDITQQRVSAITNAANSRLAGGGGVDGAIHRAGGPAIMAECDKIRREQGGCPTGQAVITTGGDLYADHVIHTVGPIWEGGMSGEPELLASCYRQSLKLAVENELKTIAFPSISTGVYGYPMEKAAIVAIETVTLFLEENEEFKEVRFVLFSVDDLKQYQRLIA
ncbi:O-acetyl-ADP-ribose deacetylase [Candidatus Poribacteria bacterium]|nr:O-acetyl-ADP-ribose deacetylase [Candidatus Poribacteria bacterium]